MTSVSAVVATILIVASNVNNSIIYVALLLWHATNTTQITVAPTVYLDVALKKMLYCHQLLWNTCDTNYCWHVYNSDHRYTSNIKAEISAGRFKEDNPEVIGLTHLAGCFDSSWF